MDFITYKYAFTAPQWTCSRGPYNPLTIHMNIMKLFSKGKVHFQKLVGIDVTNVAICLPLSKPILWENIGLVYPYLLPEKLQCNGLWWMSHMITIFNPIFILFFSEYCTFSQTGEVGIEQKLYSCVTCNMQDGHCICAICINNCHYGNMGCRVFEEGVQKIRNIFA